MASPIQSGSLPQATPGINEHVKKLQEIISTFYL